MVFRWVVVTDLYANPSHAVAKTFTCLTDRYELQNERLKTPTLQIVGEDKGAFVGFFNSSL